MSSWIQLSSINPPGPIWVNLDAGYYMNAVATGTAIHFGGAAIGQTIAAGFPYRQFENRNAV
jgi:hypothetical protein